MGEVLNLTPFEWVEEKLKSKPPKFGNGRKYRYAKGRTSSQIWRAPRGWLFLWPVEATIDYPIKLAEHFRRTDLTIIGPSYLLERRWVGQRVRGLVADHRSADILNDEEWDALYAFRTGVDLTLPPEVPVGKWRPEDRADVSVALEGAPP